jgi:hypothetical protein
LRNCIFSKLKDVFAIISATVQQQLAQATIGKPLTTQQQMQLLRQQTLVKQQQQQLHQQQQQQQQLRTMQQKLNVNLTVCSTV